MPRADQNRHKGLHQGSQTLRFGVFEVDLQAGELRRAGVLVHLQQQPFEMLLTLLERPGEVVSREELVRRLWSDNTFVDFDAGLNTTAKRLRETLGDTADRPRFVQTLARRGYRFIAPVEGARTPRRLPPSWALWGVSGLVLALIFVYARMWEAFPQWWRGSARIESIAVLPLTNLSPDPEAQYLADGLTAQLITTLARIKAWRVTSWTSVSAYRSSRKPLGRIADELGVQAVLEGSFQRLDDRVFVTAKLVQASKDRILWAKSYQRDIRDASALNDELVHVIAADFRVVFPLKEQGRLSRSRQVDPAAYDAYLHGRFYQLRETGADATIAIRWFEEAVRIDPGYAPAYAALAHTYNTTGQISGNPSLMERTREFAQKALEIDPGVAEAHAMLGAVKALYDWDFAGAERELKVALEINPSDADALVYYATLLDALGRVQDAIAMAKLAIQVDPQNPTRRDTLGFRYYFARMYDVAARQFQESVRDHPNGWVAHLGLGVVSTAQGRHEEAIEQLKMAVEMSGGANEAWGALAAAYASAGRRREALGLLKDFPPHSETLTPMSMAEVWVSLGEADRCLEALAQAYAQRSYRIGLLSVDPRYDGIRSEPRFQDLLRRIGLRL